MQYLCIFFVFVGLFYCYFCTLVFILFWCSFICFCAFLDLSFTHTIFLLQEITCPKVIKQYTYETKTQRSDHESTNLEPFPFKPEPQPPKTVRCPPPPSPSKFIKGEFRESDYESDYEKLSRKEWKNSQSYKPVHPILTPTHRPQSQTGKSPAPPSEFEVPPTNIGPLRPKFEPIEKVKQTTTMKRDCFEKSQVNKVFKPIAAKPTRVTEYIITPGVMRDLKPGSPPEMSYAPPVQQTRYYRSTTSAPYHNATQTETSNIVELNESTENSRRFVNIQQTTKVIQFGDQQRQEYRRGGSRRGSVPCASPKPGKFVKGEFRDSDYETEIESVKIRPKWIPDGSDNDEPHYRRVRAPTFHRSSSVPARGYSSERVLTPMEFDTKPAPMPTKIDLTDSVRTYKKESSQQKYLQSSNGIKPGSPPEYGFIPAKTVAKAATKMATKQMDEMSHTFKSKAQQFVQDVMTDVNKKQNYTRPILKTVPKQTSDSDAQVYREESRVAQHGK